MPFEIVRNDIVNMQVDAVVNTANPSPIIGYGVDAGIHKAAGPRLLEARQKIGDLDPGEAAITPGFDLPAKYVIHAVGPVWQDGTHNEEALLRRCYDSALQLALEQKCESIAFPLMSAGNHGFPKGKAMGIAVSAFSQFLMEHEMQIYLVVFGKAALDLSEKLFQSVASYIDENYIIDKTMDEYGIADKKAVREEQLLQIQQELSHRSILRREREVRRMPAPASGSMPRKESLEDLLKNADAGFSETLMKLIDRTGKTDAEIYKKANIDRKLFSKIRNNPAYKPSKITALAFAIALELSLEETRDFLARAGYALSHSSKFDIIVEYFIRRGIYDIFEINSYLFQFDQPTIAV
ncbi:MAG: RNase III inhibitor [Clostridiales bacterium]|nr:RNase III inhibitor [Clostridiales bacterium]